MTSLKKDEIKTDIISMENQNSNQANTGSLSQNSSYNSGSNVAGGWSGCTNGCSIGACHCGSSAGQSITAGISGNGFISSGVSTSGPVLAYKSLGVFDDYVVATLKSAKVLDEATQEMLCEYVLVNLGKEGIGYRISLLYERTDLIESVKEQIFKSSIFAYAAYEVESLLAWDFTETAIEIEDALKILVDWLGKEESSTKTNLFNTVSEHSSLTPELAVKLPWKAPARVRWSDSFRALVLHEVANKLQGNSKALAAFSELGEDHNGTTDELITLAIVSSKE